MAQRSDPRTGQGTGSKCGPALDLTWKVATRPGGIHVPYLESSLLHISQHPYLCDAMDFGKGEGEETTVRILSPPARAEHPPGSPVTSLDGLGEPVTGES
ncbi:hypothetical protein D623_10035462 [Myotis brandtii]|uniref:Uncharacterized protein n=1 Tax=Myotis brandtii TaxID=109478 RepID=S7MML6_MYOBR|nr:hypothetical protein D623_10035462 [Myotis brandtii]